MSIFKRVGLAVSAQVERLVGEIENHDAVVEAGLRESRRLYARAKVRRQGLQREGVALRRRLEELRAKEQAWRERALASHPAEDDENTALECVSRARQAGRQAEAVNEVYQRHLDVEQRLDAELDNLKQRVCEMEHRRSLMRSREAAAAAAAGIGGASGDALPDLDDSFERWEIRLTEAELSVDACGGSGRFEPDPFEARFVAGEERASLQAELAAMRQSVQGKAPQGVAQ